MLHQHRGANTAFTREGHWQKFLEDKNAGAVSILRFCKCVLLAFIQAAAILKKRVRSGICMTVQGPSMGRNTNKLGIHNFEILLLV